MLASSTKNIFSDKSWVYELKWDGYRVMAHVKQGKVQLYSRNGISFNSKFRSLAKELEKVEHDVILDGAVVLIDQAGLPQFDALQSYHENSSGSLRYPA
jgi:bifunctional non-homologous end joining protein LigD